MQSSTLLLTLFLTSTLSVIAEAPPEDWVAQGEKRRAEIPLGGDFNPDPKLPVFVAVGHGARIVVSRDDGMTWKQVFFGYPGSDHGGWATSSIAYTNGVFALPVGWTQPTSYLASEDGVHWRHLTNGEKPLNRNGGPSLMPTTMSMAGGKGVFIGSGYTTFTATPDLGKTWSTFSISSFKEDPRPRLNTHHVKTLYCGDRSGRFLAIGDDRSPENAKFGNLFASDDLGKTWQWLDPKGLDKANGKGGMAATDEMVLLLDKTGENAFRSTDGGQTWDGPHPTGTQRVTLSAARGEFWLAGKLARASKDGVTWRDVGSDLPSGKIAASDKGTLVITDSKNFSLLRSADDGKTWKEVFRFEPETEHVHGSQGLRDLTFGYLTPAKDGSNSSPVKAQ